MEKRDERDRDQAWLCKLRGIQFVTIVGLPGRVPMSDLKYDQKLILIKLESPQIFNIHASTLLSAVDLLIPL